VQENEDPEPVADSQPAATQPLRVMLAQVGENTRSNVPDLGPLTLNGGQEADVTTPYHHPRYPDLVTVRGGGVTHEKIAMPV